MVGGSCQNRNRCACSSAALTVCFSLDWVCFVFIESNIGFVLFLLLIVWSYMEPLEHSIWDIRSSKTAIHCAWTQLQTLVSCGNRIAELSSISQQWRPHTLQWTLVSGRGSPRLEIWWRQGGKGYIFNLLSVCCFYVVFSPSKIHHHHCNSVVVLLY